MWDQFEEFTGSIADVVQDVQSASEDIRRATVYTQQELRATQDAIRNRQPTDGSLNFVQRTWFYATDQEKLFIVLGVVGLTLAVWPYIQKNL